MLDAITIKGAREHNLKDVSLTIPRDKLVVITGLSGSGKSSLAFDTIYAEGQRRYVESLSSYARQFLGLMEKPDVDQIDGLSPAVSIDQKGASRNPRSTVATVTEIYDHLRLLFARTGTPHCPLCGRIIAAQTVQEIVDAILQLPDGTKAMLLAPLVKDRKGEHMQVLATIRKSGYARVRVDGHVRDLSEEITLDKMKKHTLEVIVDRVVLHNTDEDRQRLSDSVELALRFGEGMLVVAIDKEADKIYSQSFACPYDGFSMGEIEPRTFSFNAPHGACPACTGLGHTLEVDPDLVIQDESLSINGGAITPWRTKTQDDDGYRSQVLKGLSQKMKFSLDVPWRELSKQVRSTVLYGLADDTLDLTYVTRYGRARRYDMDFSGVIPNLKRRYEDTTNETLKEEILRFMTELPCPTCKGLRLKPEVLGVTIDGKSIMDIVSLPISLAATWAEGLPKHFDTRKNTIAKQILKEIKARLGFLVDVGLDYLTLDRSAGSLSGGEAQRIRLATQIGSGLMGVLYVLDEPSIGLHQRDNAKLIKTLEQMRDVGNTVLVVEHDEDTMRTADWIIDVGPGAGEHGGEIVAQGKLEDIIASKRSLTGKYLSGEKRIPLREHRRPNRGEWLTVRGARENNLKNVTVKIPLGMFVAVTGVSGSGKSSLINDIVFRKLASHLYKAKDKPGSHDALEGIDLIDKVVDVDQSPIGRTPRSNPATYTGLFTPIRELFATLPEARTRGYNAGRFSFNVRGGRCEACSGDGIVKIEMQFLPDVYVPCEVCEGRRYNREALEIKYKGKNISDVLNMTVEEALTFFTNVPSIKKKLQTLSGVGLGYIHLGQSATTLSGGEAQRVKLSSELSKRSTGKTIYILDEPTTGLHFADVEKLLEVLHTLVETGNTVITIEHNLDVIKTADWIIDLGPEGGAGGGQVIAEGTPEHVASVQASYTGQFLAPMLKASRTAFVKPTKATKTVVKTPLKAKVAGKRK